MCQNLTKTLFVCFCFLITFCLLPYVHCAQGDDFAKATDFFPPPPNASAIIKNNLLSVNKNTGAPAFSIPLQSISGYNISTGISLNYSSTGIKVDEIASRIGMGWSLTAGGVITRTVRGAADELTSRISPPSAFSNNCGTYFFLKKVNDCNEGLRFDADAEPDYFNFCMNGISGSFLLNNQDEPVIVSSEKLIISINFSSSALWNFKIVNTDGMIYYFGGAEASEKTKRESSCGRNYEAAVPTSWYLTKIEHPNGETLSFYYTALSYNYETGVSEAMSWLPIVPKPDYYDPNGNTSSDCPFCPTAPSPSRCVNKVKTDGVYLTTVRSSTNNWAQIVYTNRSDCGDVLVKEIRFYSSVGSMGYYAFTYQTFQSDLNYANEFAPGYDKTPYLTILSEYSSAGVMIGQYAFTYLEPGSRPPRLSFSQDHWGHFNGERNYSTFIAKPEDPVMMARFPYANANREAIRGFSEKGMLSKIVYPGGGIDSIAYEPNVTSQSPQGPIHVLNAQVTGTSTFTTATYTTSFSIGYTQNVELQVSCNATGNEMIDPAKNTGTVELYNSAGSVHYGQISAAFNAIYTYQLQPGVYTLKTSANGSIISTRASVQYRPQSSRTDKDTRLIGGCRVKYLYKGSPGHQTIIKRYFYGEILTPTISSINEVPERVYIHKSWRAVGCSTRAGGGSGAAGVTLGLCEGYSMSSNSLSNIFDYGGSPVSYRSVIESDGDAFANGCIQTIFYTKADQPGVVMWGDDIKGSTLSNFSAFLNGKPQEEIVYKKTSQGSLVPLKKSQYFYKYHTQDQAILNAYTVEKKYNPVGTLPGEPCDPLTPVLTSLTNAYNAVRYDMMSYWVYMDSSVEITYDQDGGNPLTQYTLYNYDNALHHNVTKTRTLTSKSELLTTDYTYPHDFSSSPVYASMIKFNILNKPVTVTNYVGSLKTSTSRINYKDWGSNNIGIGSVEKALADNNFITEGTINLTDYSGRILQYTGRDGIVKSVIWGGEKSKYAIANISGAGYSQAIANLTVPVQDLGSTDETLIKDQVNLIRTALPNAKVETYLYKPKTGLSSKSDVNNNTITYYFDDKDRLNVVKDNDGNILKKFEYYLDPSIESNLKGFTNSLRSKDFTCQACLPGYTSQLVNYSVPKGKYFSAVSINEANAAADADLNLFGQAYADKYAICTKGIFIFYNNEKSGYFTKSDCGQGYVGTSVRYVIPAKTYSGPTQEDADALANYYLNLQGPGYANSNGSCIATCTGTSCTGENKKCINGLCQSGIKIYTSSIQVQGSLYQCVFHYEWSDGTWSENYTEYTSTRCPLDP